MNQTPREPKIGIFRVRCILLLGLVFIDIDQLGLISMHTFQKQNGTIEGYPSNFILRKD